MKTIDGYVCITKKEYPKGLETCLLFGENKGKGEKFCENIVSNNFSTYKSKTLARKGQKQLLQRNEFDSVQIAKLHMDIVETKDELNKLKDCNSLVVIMIDDDLGHKYNYLLGPIVDGLPDFGPIPGAFLKDTNFKTFDSLDKALYLAREVNRQAQCGAPIATFSLEYIK